MAELVRSVLFVPGDDERKLAKAATSSADALIVDLEDAVAIERKPRARDMLAGTLAALSARRTFVRMNALDTGLAEADVAAIVSAGGRGLVAPKVNGVDDVEAIVSMLAGADVAVIPLIESAAAVAAIAAIAAASPAIERLALGSADLTRDLGIETGDEPGLGLLLDAVRAQLVLGSRAGGVGAPLDGPLLAVRDQERFRTHCIRARGMGFAGVLCLHPDQVTVANDVFTPSPESVARARAIVDAFDAQEGQGNASITVDGAFVDYPIAESARALLARAEQIGV
jgi:citrate lyase subunit beta/citryl-CoA lyase